MDAGFTPYHISVLLKESVASLDIKPDGVYVDVTFGAGGHSKSIVNELNAKGHLYAFDQDEDAFVNSFSDERFTLIFSNFRYLRPYLKLEGVTSVNGILADLGVSSYQFDQPERGFSYRFDAKLDMRMNDKKRMTAADIIENYSEDELWRIFGEYGEVRNAKTLAKSIVQIRKVNKIETTFGLNRVLQSNQIGGEWKYFAQVYQALRMEVNDEMGALKDMLEQGRDLLVGGGRFAVITFHSIEDRMVKNFFKTGNVRGDVVKDAFGNVEKPFRLVYKKVIEASLEEQKNNSRSRSAKLRVAEKIGVD